MKKSIIKNVKNMIDNFGVHDTVNGLTLIVSYTENGAARSLMNILMSIMVKEIGQENFYVYDNDIDDFDGFGGFIKKINSEDRACLMVEDINSIKDEHKSIIYEAGTLGNMVLCPIFLKLGPRISITDDGAIVHEYHNVMLSNELVIRANRLFEIYKTLGGINIKLSKSRDRQLDSIKLSIEEINKCAGIPLIFGWL